METIEKVLLIGVIILILALPVTLKIGGASSWEKKVNLEKTGYCHLKYGEEYKLEKQADACYIMIEKEKESIYFTQEEFRNFCPENKLLSFRFFSECWKASN